MSDSTDSGDIDNTQKALITLGVLGACIVIAIVVAKIVDYCYDQHIAISDDASDISEHTRDLIRLRVAAKAFGTKKKKEKEKEEPKSVTERQTKIIRIWSAKAKESRRIADKIRAAEAAKAAAVRKDIIIRVEEAGSNLTTKRSTLSVPSATLTLHSETEQQQSKEDGKENEKDKQQEGQTSTSSPKTASPKVKSPFPIRAELSRTLSGISIANNASDAAVAKVSSSGNDSVKSPRGSPSHQGPHNKVHFADDDLEEHRGALQGDQTDSPLRSKSEVGAQSPRNRSPSPFGARNTPERGSPSPRRPGSRSPSPNPSMVRATGSKPSSGPESPRAKLAESKPSGVATPGSKGSQTKSTPTSKPTATSAAQGQKSLPAKTDVKVASPTKTDSKNTASAKTQEKNSSPTKTPDSKSTPTNTQEAKTTHAKTPDSKSTPTKAIPAKTPEPKTTPTTAPGAKPAPPKTPEPTPKSQKLPEPKPSPTKTSDSKSEQSKTTDNSVPLLKTQEVKTSDLKLPEIKTLDSITDQSKTPKSSTPEPKVAESKTSDSKSLTSNIQGSSNSKTTKVSDNNADSKTSESKPSRGADSSPQRQKTGIPASVLPKNTAKVQPQSRSPSPVKVTSTKRGDDPEREKTSSGNCTYTIVTPLEGSNADVSKEKTESDSPRSSSPNKTDNKTAPATSPRHQQQQQKLFTSVPKPQRSSSPSKAPATQSSPNTARDSSPPKTKVPAGKPRPKSLDVKDDPRVKDVHPKLAKSAAVYGRATEDLQVHRNMMSKVRSGAVSPTKPGAGDSANGTTDTPAQGISAFAAARRAKSKSAKC